MKILKTIFVSPFIWFYQNVYMAGPNKVLRAISVFEAENKTATSITLMRYLNKQASAGNTTSSVALPPFHSMRMTNCLDSLERLGLITVTEPDSQKLYAISDKGKEYLSKLKT
ncbi:MAG: hypothetical protein OXR68_08060 [Alphaproteobacteria bacterium]|nr:hypothetical protein [Alphaproteobacteria bacterium]MDD9920559.1 hypothetical protein [Alphaproteobacteria bacterium]